uniref:PLAT domain-containing protein n=1 Tax=Parascaris equorum TaxID=6256 RepID=A0A914RBT5_PAREQ
QQIIESASAQHSAIDEEDGSNKSEQAVAAESQDESNTEMEQDGEKGNKTATSLSVPFTEAFRHCDVPGMTYTVSVITGNRWAADSDKDLYIILYGDSDKSDKCPLRQDYINWLQTNEPKFRQNRAGIFIERVLVTENIADGRQFLFECGKWLDSGQVDGKIERMIKTTAFYYISSIPEDNTSSKGRWELILHTGLQVDFGDIGDLLKIRIEVDGSGVSPDYFLNKVELRDLDTEERMVCFVGKWLRWKGNEK